MSALNLSMSDPLQRASSFLRFLAGLEKPRFLGRFLRFSFEKFFGGFSVERRPVTKIRPRKEHPRKILPLVIVPL